MTPAEGGVLLAYNAWANRRLLRATAALSRELLRRDLGTSHGSAWTTLLHIAWGEWLWLGRCQGAAPRGLDPRDCGDLPDLEARWAEIGRDQVAFVARLSAPDLARRISYENPPGTPWTYPLEEMLRHVVNHSTYHRGQVASQLRQLGITPLPTDYLVFFDEGMPATAV